MTSAARRRSGEPARPAPQWNDGQSTADWSESRDCGFFASLRFLRSYLLLKVGTLCSFGALCGFWYRERIEFVLGVSSAQVRALDSAAGWSTAVLSRTN